MNPGAGRQKEGTKKKGIALFFVGEDETVHRSSPEAGAQDWTGPGTMDATIQPPPHSLPPPPAYFPAGIHLGTHMGATASVPHEQGGRVPSLNSPDALACQPDDLSQAEAKPPESKTNIHSELIDFFPLFSNKNDKKNTI